MTKARRGRNGRADKDARHVRLYHWVLGSEAWKSLNSNARAAYIELASKYAGVGSNNGRIGCSVRQIANALHVGKATAQKALADLQERGFIVAMQKGAFSWKTGPATEWRLTDKPAGVEGVHALATEKAEAGTSIRTERYLSPNRPVPHTEPPQRTSPQTVPDAEP